MDLGSQWFPPARNHLALDVLLPAVVPGLDLSQAAI